MEKFCGRCGQPISRCTCGGSSAGGMSAGGTFEVSPTLRAMRLGAGEVVVRSYVIAEHWLNKFGPKVGVLKLVVTSKRFVLVTERRALIHSYTTVNETLIDTIEGFSGNVDYRWSTLGILLALAVAVAAPFLIFKILGFWVLACIPFLWLFAAWLVLQAIKPITAMRLTGGLGNNNHMNHAVGVMPQKSGLLLAKLSTSFVPTKDAEALLAEACAIVQDIREYGDRAVARWQSR